MRRSAISEEPPGGRNLAVRHRAGFALRADLATGARHRLAPEWV